MNQRQQETYTKHKQPIGNSQYYLVYQDKLKQQQQQQKQGDNDTVRVAKRHPQQAKTNGEYYCLLKINKKYILVVQGLKKNINNVIQFL
jgi:hypothetical protein